MCCSPPFHNFNCKLLSRRVAYAAINSTKKSRHKFLFECVRFFKCWAIVIYRKELGETLLEIIIIICIHIYSFGYFLVSTVSLDTVNSGATSTWLNFERSRRTSSRDAISLSSLPAALGCPPPTADHPCRRDSVRSCKYGHSLASFSFTTYLCLVHKKYPDMMHLDGARGSGPGQARSRAPIGAGPAGRKNKIQERRKGMGSGARWKQDTREEGEEQARPKDFAAGHKFATHHLPLIYPSIISQDSRLKKL